MTDYTMARCYVSMCTDTMRWFTLPLNPEPWKVGPLDLGRKNGHIFPKIGPDAGLVAFQEAVRETIGEQPMLTGHIVLRFFFWRQQATYQMENGKRKMRHVADATNLQKALEDALQGVLFPNDREVDDVHSVIVEQGPKVTPLIIIGVDSHDHEMSDGIFELPPIVYSLLAKMDETQMQLEVDSLAPHGAHPDADNELF